MISTIALALTVIWKTLSIEVGYYDVLFLATMKKVDPKEPVIMGVLDEAVEAILKGVETMFGNFREEMKTKFSMVDKRFDKLEAGQKDLQRQINDLKYDTPTQKEFNTLKSRVDKYHPLT